MNVTIARESFSEESLSCSRMISDFRLPVNDSDKYE